MLLVLPASGMVVLLLLRLPAVLNKYDVAVAAFLLSSALAVLLVAVCAVVWGVEKKKNERG